MISARADEASANAEMILATAHEKRATTDLVLATAEIAAAKADTTAADTKPQAANIKTVFEPVKMNEKRAVTCAAKKISCAVLCCAVRQCQCGFGLGMQYH